LRIRQVVEHVRASNRTGRNGCPQTPTKSRFSGHPQGLCACAAGVSARIRRYRHPEFTQVKAWSCSKINDLLAGGQPWWPAPANRSGGRRLRYFDLWATALVFMFRSVGYPKKGRRRSSASGRHFPVYLDFAATCYRCKHRPGSSRGSIPLRPQGLCACAAGVSARIRRYRRPEFTQVKAWSCSKINDLAAGGVIGAKVVASV
jgi:hypothetical protein